MAKRKSVPRVSGSQARRRERGQIMIMVGLMAIVLFAIVGLAVDVGRIFITKAELSRDVDAAALAGVLELPDVSEAQAKAMAYLAENDAAATGSADLCPAPADNCLYVEGTKSVDMYFLSLLGFGDVDVSAHAKAGFGIQPLDVYLAIDATGSMGASPCDAQDDNPGCPIWEAKNAANSFVNTLLGDTPSGYTVIGLGAYRGCYNPPRSYSSCISVGSMVENLTSSKATLQATVSNIQALGGTGTNTCLGMLKAQEVIFGAGSHTESNTRRFLVLLADGDNTYNSVSYNWSQNSPDPACRPTSPGTSDGYVGTDCRSAQTQEKKLDIKTWTLAKQMEAQGIEIYVVGFGACDGGDSNIYTNAQCDSQIGNNDHDDIADERLAKCIATSTSGTNDHYFYVSQAADLPTIFTTIAQQIAHRLIE